MDDFTNLSGDYVIKSMMKKVFDNLRETLEEEKLKDFFMANYFGYFIDLSEYNNALFQITVVYDIFKRRIKYDENKEEDTKNDEFWINYITFRLFFRVLG